MPTHGRLFISYLRVAKGVKVIRGETTTQTIILLFSKQLLELKSYAYFLRYSVKTKRCFSDCFYYFPRFQINAVILS